MRAGYTVRTRLQFLTTMLQLLDKELHFPNKAGGANDCTDDKKGDVKWDEVLDLIFDFAVRKYHTVEDEVSICE